MDSFDVENARALAEDGDIRPSTAQQLITTACDEIETLRKQRDLLVSGLQSFASGDISRALVYQAMPMRYIETYAKEALTAAGVEG